jgi:hypothetical protein
MGRTACTEPQCLYKGDLYLLPHMYLHIYTLYTDFWRFFHLPLRKDTIWYDIFYCNWVASRWQLFSTHIQPNNTENLEIVEQDALCIVYVPGILPWDYGLFARYMPYGMCCMWFCIFRFFSYTGMGVCFFCFIYCCVVVVVLNATFILVFLNKRHWPPEDGRMTLETWRGVQFYIIYVRIVYQVGTNKGIIQRMSQNKQYIEQHEKNYIEQHNN